MDDWFCQYKHQQAADDDNYLRYQAHLFCIVYRLILSSGTDTLSYYIHQTDTDTDGCNTIQIFQNICHRLCCDCRSTKSRHRRLDRQLTKLKHPVFDTRRDTKRQDHLNLMPVRADLYVIPHTYLFFWIPQKIHDNDRTENS